MANLLRERQAIETLYAQWEEETMKRLHDPVAFLEDFTPKDRKKMFLASSIVGLVTDQHQMDLEFGSMILETMNRIQEGTIYAYTENQETYRNYLISYNFISDWVAYETSVRYPYFNSHRALLTPFESLVGAGYHSNSIQVTNAFMGWFIGYLNADEETEEAGMTMKSDLKLENLLKDAGNALSTLKRLHNLVPEVEDEQMLKEVHQVFLAAIEQMDAIKERFKPVATQDVILSIEEHIILLDRAITIRIGQLIANR